MEPKNNSAEVPSQAVGHPSLELDDPQPKSQGISHERVLFDSGDSFKRYMHNHIETLIQKMTTNNIISKNLVKRIKGEHKSIRLDLLLGIMKEMSLEKFIAYLKLLLAMSEEQERDAKHGAEKSLHVKAILQDDTKQLMRIMKGSLEAMKPTPGSELQAVVAEFVDFVSQDCSIQSQSAVDLQPINLPHDLPQHLRPPEGQLGNAEFGVFTKNEGGTLYSALHGVSVTIPPNAIPEAFSPFSLSMHFYLQQPFTLMDDADPCSVIVWLHQNPHFHFLEEVTVKIPHSAIVDNSLCVLTWGKDKQLNLNTEVPADFSDGYHAVIKVKHFFPKVAAKKRKRKQTGSKDSKKMKLESTAGEDKSGFKYSITCSMPSDRSRGDWKVHFAAWQSYPTGILLLRQLPKKQSDKDYSQVDDVEIRGGFFEMFPDTWSDSNWAIDATVSPALISEEQILPFPEHKAGQSFPYPPTLCFEVSRLSENDHSKLRQRIYAQGAVVVNGNTPSFLISSTPPPIVKGERVLFISPYLYGVDSDIIRVLTTHQGQDLILDTRTSEHLKFLADISLQLSDTQQLCVALDIRPNKKEDTFTILGNWVASKGGAASLIQLKEQLKTIDIVDIAMYENEDSSDLLSPHLEDHLIMDVFMMKDRSAPSYTAMLNLSIKLQNCWKNVGRLLGISPNELDNIVLPEKSSNIIDPPSYQLIYNWQRREGRGATFGALFKAIHRVFHHQLELVNDAHLFCVRYVHEHLPIPSSCTVSVARV